MSRIWLLALVFGTACNGAELRSAAVRQADSLPENLDDQEQPRLILRCEDGRVGAYIVVGTSDGAPSAPLDPEAVPVRLDSAPSC